MSGEVVSVARVYRDLLKAVVRHIGKEDHKAHFIDFVKQEFRNNANSKKINLARDYAYLLNSIHSHKDLLFSYNIAVDRTEEMKRVLDKSAASVGLRLPELRSIESFQLSIEGKSYGEGGISHGEGSKVEEENMAAWFVGFNTLKIQPFPLPSIGPLDVRCNLCREGRYNLCPEIKFFSTPPVHGSLANQVVHPADLCFKLPENVSLKEGAMCEPLSVGVHACRRAEVGHETNVLVMGAGPIGLVTILVMRTVYP